MTKTKRRHFSDQEKVAILKRHLLEKTPISDLCDEHKIYPNQFYDWQNRFGKVNEHHVEVPRDHWLTGDEKQNICSFARANPLEGYRRLTFMMLDANIVACSPASVYRVLKQNHLLAGSTPVASTIGHLSNALKIHRLTAAHAKVGRT